MTTADLPIKRLSTEDQYLTSITKHHYTHRTKLDTIAKLLTEEGYVSTTGKILSPSHISNFEGKLGLNRMEAYTKDNYLGLNHINCGKIKAAGLWEDFENFRAGIPLTKNTIKKIVDNDLGEIFLTITNIFISPQAELNQE